MTELGYKTLRESIVDIIRKRIINRELQPGQKIMVPVRVHAGEGVMLAEATNGNL